MTEKKKQLPLATFRIAPDKADVWEKFKNKVEDNKTTGAAIFWQFVQNYVDSVDTNLDISTYHVDTSLDERIDVALEAKVDFSIRDISRVVNEQYNGLVGVVAQNMMDIDKNIDTHIDDKLTGIQNALTQHDLEIDALKLEFANIKTAIASLTSEAKAPANFTQTSERQGSSAPDIAEVSLESDALPIIAAIQNIAAPSIENSLDSESLSDAIAATDDSEISKGMNTNEAFAIAQKRGYKGNGKSFRDRFDKQDMAKDFGLSRISHYGGREKWLYFDTKPHS